MKYNPSKHHRHSIRLRGYDYSSSGAYFVTANVQDRLCLFGTVHQNGVDLYDIGNIARQCWKDIPVHFPHVELDEFIIMPDHMHGIIFILPNDDNQKGVPDHGNRRGVLHDGDRRRVQLNAPTLNAKLNTPTTNAPTGNVTTRKDNYYSNISPQKKSLSVIVRTYKAAVTTICRENGFHHFKWQRNYHDEIIRSEGELNAIRKYIINNPLSWWCDKENPEGRSGKW
jgi:REP element-mobilizing transposase RayT